MFESNHYISRHLILNQETNSQDLDDFEFCFIELDKFAKELTQLNSLVDKWLYFIKNGASLEMIPKELTGNPALEQAFDAAKMYSWNKKEMEIYDYIDLQKGSELDALRTAEQKGEKRGLKKGIEQERALGEKKREQEKVETAKNAIKQGLDNQTISAITGLPPEEVEKLR